MPTPTPTPTPTPAPTPPPQTLVINLDDVAGSLTLPSSVVEPGGLTQPTRRIQLLPELPRLDLLTLSFGVTRSQDDPDFLLPNVSDRDY